jgi:hypothetical protein
MRGDGFLRRKETSRIRGVEAKETCMKGKYEPLRRLSEEEALQRIADDPQQNNYGLGILVLALTIAVIVLATLLMVAVLNGGLLP